MDSTEKYFFSLNMAKIAQKPNFITTPTAMYFHNCQYFVTEEHTNHIFKYIKSKVFMLTLLSYFSDFEYCLYSNNSYFRGIFTSITFETKIL